MLKKSSSLFSHSFFTFSLFLFFISFFPLFSRIFIRSCSTQKLFLSSNNNFIIFFNLFFVYFVVLAGFVSLVNAARAKIGKPPIGFLNKMLWETGTRNASLFKDVTSGHNKCCAQQMDSGAAPVCCDTGFTSAAGWDPVVRYTQRYVRW